MASTPLYKALKPNGTSFYAFPGAAEDISAAYQNSNYKFYFSKYVLLDLPKQDVVSSTISNPIYWDFDNSFSRSQIATPVTNYGDGVVESLRNYVANHECVLRESRLTSTEYYYDTNALETTSEKIFFKWCKKLGLIDFEPASPQDDYFGNSGEFLPNGIGDEYLPEFLWRERQVKPYSGINFYQTNNINYSGKLEVEFLDAGTPSTNFRVGDIVNCYNVTLNAIKTDLITLGYTDADGLNMTVLDIISGTAGQKIVFDIPYYSQHSNGGSPVATFELVYHQLVQYVGEINGVSNVQEANRSYTEVYAHIPDHTGRTPDILFRIGSDVNYKPNITLPILPRQYQAEILGAENFGSPIVSTPQNYPGTYYGQFDTNDFTYETASGDVIRRTGNYFGVNGDVNTPSFNGSTIDGIGIDFNTAHYVKMNSSRNVTSKNITTFDQFNALAVGGELPVDFEFNAILWYYTVERDMTLANGTIQTEVKSNLYGITFLNNPDTNDAPGEQGLRFPTYKKLVSNPSKNQDGTSYAFNLNLNFNILNDNPVAAYNPEAINSLFNMDKFNLAMSKLAATNDSFINLLAEQVLLKQEIQSIKSLIYTQTDINTLNGRINNLDLLLRLYSTMQLESSSTIRVNSSVAGSTSRLTLDTIDTPYSTVNTILTSSMYNAQGYVPIIAPVPENRRFLIRIYNNDSVQLNLPVGQKLTVILDKDLALLQSCDIYVQPERFSTENKKLDIFIRSNYSGTGVATDVLLVGSIDLPVSFNRISQSQNSAYLWKNSNLDIDFSKEIRLLQNNKLEVPFVGDINVLQNTLKVGDSYQINNLFVGTQSVYNFSGQYVIDSVIGITSSYVQFDMNVNTDFVDFYASSTLPVIIHGTSSTQLSNIPYLSLNKGKKINLTRISNSTNLSERYNIDVSDIM